MHCVDFDYGFERKLNAHWIYELFAEGIDRKCL
jgi:hypothetical protein